MDYQLVYSISCEVWLTFHCRLSRIGTLNESSRVLPFSQRKKGPARSETHLVGVIQALSGVWGMQQMLRLGGT